MSDNGSDSQLGGVMETTDYSLATSHTASEERLPIEQLSEDWMVWLVKKDYIEQDWEKRQHIHLDFSGLYTHEHEGKERKESRLFKLNTFKPHDFNYGGKPKKSQDRNVVNEMELRTMPVFKLISLNLDHNELEDNVFDVKDKDTKSLTGALFSNLRILKMNSNKLAFPQILLPQLRELYLSRNDIVWFPLLAGLPQLEILILSHNKIKSLREENFQEGTPEKFNLKTLDLSSNVIDIKVSQLNGVLKKFEKIFKLTALQWKDNPFCNFFNEYQMLTVYYLQNLERLDDLDLEKVPGLSKELTNQAISYFGFQKKWADIKNEPQAEGGSESEQRMDKIFKQKDAEIEERKARFPQGVKAYDQVRRNPRVPEIPDLVKLLDDAIADPKSATTFITLAFEDACTLMKGGADQLRKTMESRKGQKDALDTFVHSALILVERYRESRMMLLKMIGKFALVSEAPLEAIANLAMGAGAPIGEIMQVLDDNVLQELSRPLTQESFRHAMVGLSHFSADSDELAETIERHDLVPLLCQKLNPMLKNSIMENKDSSLQSALLSVLRCAVQRRENAIKAMNLTDDLATRVIDVREFHDTDRGNTVMYLNITAIMVSCIGEDSQQALAAFEADYPSKLVKMALSVFDNKLKKNESTTNLQGQFCKKIGAVIEVITATMMDSKHMETLLEKPADGSGKLDDVELMRLIMKAPSENTADPVILAASLDCCRHIIMNAPRTPVGGEKPLCLQYLEVMSQHMSLQKKQNNILPYLETKKFKDMYRRCLQIQASSQDEERAIMTAQVPELGACTNKMVHHSVKKIVQFLGVFTQLEDTEDHPCYELAKHVSSKMNEAGRDRLLLKLLEVPADEVRDVVIECMKNVNAAQLDDEELDQMFEMLNPEDVKKEEALMAQILELFLNILQDEEQESDTFREKHGKAVLDKTFAILVKNAERNTHGVEEDEKQKASLSMKAVELFFVATKQENIRKHMRSQEMTIGFKQILLNEEKYNSARVQDISLEISWTGRQVENLMICMAGSEHVLPHKRQGFRLIHRVADVMEGGSDKYRRFDISARERADMEAKMWSDRKIKTAVTYADNGEYEDRTHQQQSFVSFHGLIRLLTFLEGHRMAIKRDSPDDDSFTIHSSDNLETDDQVKAAEAFFKDVLKYAKEEEARVKALKREEFDRETEVEIKLDDEEDEVMENYEKLLRDNYMQCGWQTSDTRKATGFCIPPKPRLMVLEESYLIPGTEDEVSIVYPLASLLRAVYALLLVPSVERLRLETIQLLREVNVQTRLISLIQSHGRFVDCHIAAKYLRVMSWALRMAHDQTIMQLDEKCSDDYEYIKGISVNTAFAGRCLHLLTPMLANMGRGYMLTVQQQTLCVEAVRMLAVASHAARYIKVTRTDKVQESSVEYLLTHFIPMAAVQSVLLCLLYDMQVNAGSSHGSFINAKFVRSAMQRQGLRELCCDTLVNIIYSCAAMRYPIYESFFSHQVVGKVNLRISFLNELISRVEQSKYVVAMEALLKERFMERGERILRCAEIDLPLKNKSDLLSTVVGRFSKPSLEPQMIVVTNKRFLIMERPKHGILARKCGHCPPESFCPIGPGIAKEHDYVEVSRIIRGVDSQMFVLGWVSRAGFGGQRIDGETLDIFICHRSDVRRELVETLSTLTGPDVEFRVEPQRDMLIKMSSEKKLESPIVCMSFAYCLDQKIAEFLQDPQHPVYKESGKLFLYILSESHVCEVTIKWDEWIPPFDTNVVIDVSDDEGEGKLDQEYDISDPSLLVDDNVKPNKSRLANRPYQTAASEWLTDRDRRATNSNWQPFEDELVTMKVEHAEGTKAHHLNGLYQQSGCHPPDTKRRLFKQVDGKGAIYFEERKVGGLNVPTWNLSLDGTTGGCYEVLLEDQNKDLEIPWTGEPLRWMVRQHFRAPDYRSAPTVSYVSKVEKVRNERKEAIKKDADRRAKNAAEEGKDKGVKQVQSSLMRTARSRIFENWKNWSMQSLNKIEFVAGETPVLQLGFKESNLSIRFLDDVARERWRRGLAYILNKSDTAAQWQRKWDEQDVKDLS